jgi:hypothetical protein
MLNSPKHLETRKAGPRGFVLLYMVLILSSILTALVLMASSNGSFAGNRLQLDQESANTRMMAEDCGEQLLQQVRNATTTTGIGTLSTNPGTCTYTIAGAGVPKTISLTATDGTLYKRLIITLSQLDPTFNVSWVEGN